MTGGGKPTFGSRDWAPDGKWKEGGKQTANQTAPSRHRSISSRCFRRLTPCAVGSIQIEYEFTAGDPESERLLSWYEGRCGFSSLLLRGFSRAFGSLGFTKGDYE